ncbi:MAG: methylthioribulose 1-phosphate dehydratase [Planctomycetota bacterium]
MSISWDKARFDAAAAALCNVGRELHRYGQVPATGGNFSVRLNDHCFAITRSGPHKGRLVPDDIIVADLDGKPLTDDPGKRPSAETLLHCQLYKRDATIGAALHSHCPPAVVLSRVLPTAASFVLRGYELLKAFAGTDTHDTARSVAFFDNSQDIAALAAEVEARMQSGFEPPPAPGYIIRGHGIYAWGRDLDEAWRHLDALDHLLAVELEVLRHTR